MHHYLLFTLIALLAGPGLMAQSAERRSQYLKDILEINIPQRFQQTTRRVTVQDSTWTDWLNRTGELPPDFSVMPSVPFLPDPLVLTKEGKDHPVRIIASIAPRPLMIVAPELDRHVDATSLQKSIESAKAVYNLYQKGDQFHFDTPHEVNRMTTEMNKRVADFYEKLIE